MGTNFYLYKNTCRHCGRGDAPLHIGKSSAGWCFALHVLPEEGIKDLDDWKKRFEGAGNTIKDEYGREVTPEEMIETITKREGNLGKTRKAPTMYDSLEDFFDKNYAVQGPNGLARAKVGQYCVGHGEGTWDLIPGEFS